MKVILYTQPGCPPCLTQKAWMKQLGIAFDERDVRASREHLTELLALGAQGTPTTVVTGDDGRQEIMVGFDPNRLAQLLGV
ncbi:MAG TPA: glutaredoxin domain-containing protein [Limnochordia bacterium]|nr:glutaredoxin domain-containing protein [Limnochordia bacterium]